MDAERVRYEGILRDHRPDASAQLKTEFVNAMKGRDMGARAFLDAFDMYWSGWATSSGLHPDKARLDWLCTPRGRLLLGQLVYPMTPQQVRNNIDQAMKE